LQTVHAAIVFAALACLGITLIGGCYDEFHPKKAEIKVRFGGETGLVQGSRFTVDGIAELDSVTTSEWSRVMDPGPHTFTLRRECADIEPADSIRIVVEGGRPQTIDFHVVLRCALLTVQLHPQVQGLQTGARIWLDGDLVASDIADTMLAWTLEPGDHVLRYEHEDPCVAMDPPGPTTLHLVARERPTIDVSIATNGAIVITSNTPGSQVRVDGEPRGTAPVTVNCLDEGAHEVVCIPPPASLGFAVTGDTLRTVALTSGQAETATFEFAYAPRPQTRGALLELFSYPRCPNCPASDHAIDSLEADPIYEPSAFAGTTIQIDAAGNPLYNDNIRLTRVAFYNVPNQAPIAFFNGLDRKDGSNFDVVPYYREKINQTYGQTGRVALYWNNISVEGSLLRGDLRSIALDDLSAPNSYPRLYVYWAKDGIVLPPTHDPYHVGHFNGVARKYNAPIDLKAANAATVGSVLDRAIEFDMSEDTGTFPYQGLKLVAFVQDSVSMEILQVREIRINYP
jgi:hypothetical protein